MLNAEGVIYTTYAKLRNDAHVLTQTHIKCMERKAHEYTCINKQLKESPKIVWYYQSPCKISKSDVLPLLNILQQEQELFYDSYTCTSLDK